jgi:glucose dehydrogenase
MDYEPFKVNYTAGQPYVGATLSMYPPAGESHMGNFIAWDARTGKIVWSNKEQFSVWSGALQPPAASYSMERSKATLRLRIAWRAALL